MKRDPLLVGLTGLAGTGKDSVAERLKDKYRFERYAFADPLRNMLESLLSDADIDYAYLFEHNLKEVPIPQLDISARTLMQTLGTEWGRQLRPDFWLRMAELALGLPEAPVHDRIVITDVRFPNEAEWLQRNGGVIVRVTRPVQPVRAHVSEQHIDTFEPWYVVTNDGSLDALDDQVDDLAMALDAHALDTAPNP